MTTGHTTRTSLADIAEQLMFEYEGILPLGIVSSVVLESRSVLAEQESDAAFYEVLLKVVRSRLKQLWVEELAKPRQRNSTQGRTRGFDRAAAAYIT